MRATILAAVLTVGALSLVTTGSASALAGLSAHHSAASSGRVVQARTQHYRNAQVSLSASLLRALRLLAPVPIPLLAVLCADLLSALGRAPSRADSSA